MSQSIPRISIVIPTYNRPTEVVKAVRAIQAQNFTVWELVIVNNGCTDNTEAVLTEVAAGDSRIRIETIPRTRATAARNHGIRCTKPTSEFVMLHDDDDWLFPGVLEKLLRKADERPDAVLAYGMPLNCDDSGASHEILETAYAASRLSVAESGRVYWLKPDADDTFGNVAIWSPIATFAQVLVRRSALESNGLLIDNFGIADDWDFWLRLSLLGPFARVNELVLYRRFIASNTSNNHALMAPSVMSIRHSLKFGRDLTPVQRRIAAIANAVSPYLFLVWAQRAMANGNIRRGVHLAAVCVKEVLKAQVTWRVLDRDRSFVERYANSVDASDTGFAVH
jgi:glycosyltransferase involved in cell wall biosynthesis